MTVLRATSNRPCPICNPPWLTPTQDQIVRLAAVEGMSNKEIAALIRRSVRTVENQRVYAMERTGARNFAELVYWWTLRQQEGEAE